MTVPEVAQRLADVVAIPVVPFGADGEVDVEAYGQVLDRMVDAGVHTITCNGNTGEFYALTAAEAERVVAATVERVGDRATVVAGVGYDARTAITAARHAASVGASAVMVHQPVNPYVADEGWVDYHREIADSVPDLGVVLYVRNPDTSASQLSRLATACPNVVGVKYAVPDPVRFAGILRDAGHADQLVWVDGLAELHAPGYFAYGARGFTSGLVNVAPELSLRMLQAVREGDHADAMKVWELVRTFEQMRVANASAHNVSVVKEALSLLGVCRPDVRPPGYVLDDAMRAKVGEVVRSWGIV